MRKKLLSLLTVLCLVLGMLPATAFAAAAEAYEKNEVARVITTDTEIAEDIDGLVLVDAPCKVTVKDAKLSVGIVVSPDAAGAEVILTGTTEAAEVVVLSASSVKVEETATAASVTVDAAEAAVEVAGTASEITVTENAEKTAVTVAETAKVETVSVAAPAATVEVAGEVATVAVTETAAAATVNVAETAKVTGDVTNAAPDSSVSIKGEVAGSVTTAETAKGAATEVAETAKVTGSVTNAAPDSSMKVEGKVEGGITNTETATGATLEVGEKAEITGEVTDATGELTVTGDGAANVTVSDSTTPAEEEKKDEETKDEEIANPDVPFTPVPTEPVPKIIWAPLVDQSSSDKKENLDNAKQGDPVVTSAGDKKYNVTINAAGLQKHENASGDDGYWVGFGVPLPESNTAYNAETNPSPYNYYILNKESNTWTAANIAPTRFYELGNTTFNTFYFDVYAEPTGVDAQAEDNGDEGDENDADPVTPPEPVAANQNTEQVILVTKGEKAEGENGTATTIEGGSITLGANEEIVYIFDVDINATVIPETTPAT